MVRRMTQFVEGVVERKRAAATAGAFSAIVNTPVDRGLARSNWIATVGDPADLALAFPYVEYQRETNPEKFFETANAQAAIGAARRVIDSARPGVPLFITNNVGYIVFLNDGTSVQQPAGFFERAALEGRIAARSVRVLKN